VIKCHFIDTIKWNFIAQFSIVPRLISNDLIVILPLLF
jgi:hypothetical protein